jgi:membrane protein DedA with SNARE-associated domain
VEVGVPHWAVEAIGAFGYAAVFLLVAVEGLGVPLPGETALLVAAALSGLATSRGDLDIRVVVAVAAIAAITGDTGGYVLGQRWGRPLLARWGPRVGLSAKRLAIVERFFDRYGMLAVFFGRYQAVFRTYIGMVAGIAHMPFRRFFPVRLASCIVWAVIYGLLGYFLGRQWPRVQALVHAFGLAAAVIGGAIVVAVVIFVVLRRPHLREAQQ